MSGNFWCAIYFGHFLWQLKYDTCKNCNEFQNHIPCVFWLKLFAELIESFNQSFRCIIQEIDANNAETGWHLRPANAVQSFLMTLYALNMNYLYVIDVIRQ